MTWEVRRGDCVEQMAAMPAGSVDAVVCDPPYGLSFMSKAWDRIDGEPVDPAFLHWFAGFTDGEGCFSVHKKNVNGYETYDCQFSISLRADDRPILERIQRTLGMGTLSGKDAHRTADRTRPGASPQARYSISRKADCLRLRELFYGFPLRAKKAKDLELWSDALDAWVEHEPGGGWDEVAEARNLLMASRAYVEEGIRVDPFQMWCWRWGREALRVLKPGGHCLAMGGTRTYHRLTAGLEDAGFEIRDCLSYLYGSGFPKSLDVSKAIDRAAGAEREVVGLRTYGDGQTYGQREAAGRRGGGIMGEPAPRGPDMLTAPATPDAERWQGWGTALKPAHEPVVVARKPLSGTVASTVLEHGCGALNVDGCRVGTDERSDSAQRANGPWSSSYEGSLPGGSPGHPPVPTTYVGRWPPNVLLSHSGGCVRVGTRRVKGVQASAGHRTGWAEDDYEKGTGRTHAPDSEVDSWSCEPDCPVRLLDEQTGESTSAAGQRVRAPDQAAGMFGLGQASASEQYGDSGGASRFFPTFEDTRFRYVAKAGRAERNAGLDGFEEKVAGGMAGRADGSLDGHIVTGRNVHPTVKPIELMRWLVRLVTPPRVPCPNCKGSGHEGDGLLEDDFPCRTCCGAQMVPGTVLDPFTGSGSTGAACVLEEFDFIGIEREPEYADIAEARIGWWHKHRGDGLAAAVLAAGEARDAVEATGQLELDW